jgi:hypothetical protein
VNGPILNPPAMNVSAQSSYSWIRILALLIAAVWPSFWAGKLSLNLESMLKISEEPTGHAHGASNLGELLGLHGLASLIPLLAVWVLAAVLWAWITRAEQVAKAPKPSL